MRVALLSLVGALAVLALLVTVDWRDPAARSSIMATLALELLVATLWDLVVRREKKVFKYDPNGPWSRASLFNTLPTSN